MPKKFGTNTKAKEAWDRKEAAKNAERERKEKQAEDEYWKDEDKLLLKKQQRKEEKEKKKQEILEKKQANKAALEEEMSSIKGSSKGVAAPTKVTRAEINQMKEKAVTAGAPKKATKVSDQEPLTENLNRLLIEEEQARSVDEALALLNQNAPADRHPEKRLKAAFQAFEDQNLPRLKAENPNLRLSQLKQLLKKEWQKSPENPLNQRFTSYNTKA